MFQQKQPKVLSKKYLTEAAAQQAASQVLGENWHIQHAVKREANMYIVVRTSKNVASPAQKPNNHRSQPAKNYDNPRLVRHSVYGEGIVMEAKNGGQEVHIQFSRSGEFKWVKVSELDNRKATDYLNLLNKDDERQVRRSRNVASTNVSTVPRIEIPADNHYLINRSRKLSSDPSFIARRMIEAFRVGIAPPDRITDFTFGREQEIRSMSAWLGQMDNNIMLMVGDYGMGKTHLIQYIYRKALDDGFAVAKVDADPNESPFFRPKRIYSSLLASFQYRHPGSDTIKGFDYFLQSVLETGAFKDHNYLQHVYWQSPATWHWIKAVERSVRPDGDLYKELPGLHDHQTAANIFTYLLSTFGWAAKRLMGLKGLILIFDEAESMHILDGYQYEKGMNFFRALVNTSLNNKLLLKRPYEIQGLTHGGHSSDVPFLYKSDSGLKLVFAFTRLWWDHALPELNNAARLTLEPISSQALRELQNHISDYYQEAYPSFELPELPTDAILRGIAYRNGNTRKFVKTCVEIMDIARAGNFNSAQTEELVHTGMML